MLNSLISLHFVRVEVAEVDLRPRTGLSEGLIAAQNSALSHEIELKEKKLGAKKDITWTREKKKKKKRLTIFY